MIDRDEASTLLDNNGHLFLDTGSDAGQIRRVFLDDYSGWPSFCTIDTPNPTADPGADAGTDMTETFVALHEADLSPGGVSVPYNQDKIARAPRVDPGEDLPIAEEDALFVYYGVPIDGVVPVVDHLGAVFVPTPDGVSSRPVEHPSD